MASISANADFPANGPLKRVVVVIYPGVTLLDAAGPAQVFSSASDALQRAGQRGGYELLLASPHGGEIRTDTGITVRTVPLAEATAKRIDTLIVSGGTGVFSLEEEEELLTWVRARHKEARRMATTCMGAFVAARAGLLAGQPVATHWRYTERLQREHPEARVERDPLYVRNGKMWSAAGCTSGIDLALAMVEEDFGHGIAMDVAQGLVVFLKRPGGQAQFSNTLIVQQEDRGSTFTELHAWIAGNLHNEINVEQLASCAGMSPRSFARSYKERTGVTPAKSVEMMRVEAAKGLLEQGDVPLTTIARQTGLTDEQRLRRAFQRHVGVSPSEYRRKFAVGANGG